jgi:CspA family cold shock protein
MQGVVKVYDPRSGVGVIVRDDDRSEVYLRPGSLEGSMFRMLRQGQRVLFDIDEEDGRLFARDLRFGADGY